MGCSFTRVLDMTPPLFCTWIILYDVQVVFSLEYIVFIYHLMQKWASKWLADYKKQLHKHIKIHHSL